MTSVAAERLIGEGLVMLALIAWWAIARELPEFILPGPIAVARRLAELFVTPDFLWNLFASTWRVLVSIALALLIGGSLAFLAHDVPWLETVVDQRIKPVLNSFPSIGWAILAAIWFEPGDFSVIFVEVAILIPFCLINIAEGLRNADADLMEMGRSFTRNRARMLWRLRLPLLVPYGLSATRIAYGIAWKITLVAELLGAPSGLGYLMLRAQTARDDGGTRLGEVALVDGSGRIGKLDTVFYDTLYDENAASHIALGGAYPLAVGDPDERDRMNQSESHIDFMIGSPEVVVTGIHPDGTRVPVLVGGEWAV